MGGLLEMIMKERRRQDGSKERKIMIPVLAIWRKFKSWRKKK